MIVKYETIIKEFSGKQRYDKAQNFANKNNLRVKAISYVPGELSFVSPIMTVVFEKEKRED